MRFSDNPIVFTLGLIIFLFFYAAMFGSFIFYPLWSFSYLKKRTSTLFLVKCIALFALAIINAFAYMYMSAIIYKFTQGSDAAVIFIMAITPFAVSFPIFAVLFANETTSLMKKLLLSIGVYIAMYAILFLENLLIGFSIIHTILFIIIGGYLIKRNN